jgi:hypothetical protein
MTKSIRINGRQIQLHFITGTVVGTSKSHETQTAVSGGGGSASVSNSRAFGQRQQVRVNLEPVQVTSSTVVHDQIFLRDEQEQEHVFNLQNLNVDCREGHSLTVVRATWSGNQAGRYVEVVNNSLSTTYQDSATIEGLCRPSSIPYLLLCIVLLPLLVLSYIPGKFWLVGLVVVGTLVLPARKGNRGVREFKTALSQLQA